MAFPVTRLRRLRATPALRGLVRETQLAAGDLVMPYFVHSEPGRTPIGAMPGVERVDVDALVAEAAECIALGIPGVLLFGLPATKDAEGSGAWAEDGIVQQAIRALKQAHPELLVIADLCLCEYTDHGHCGLLTADGRVDNDPSLALLARTAVAQARAGADIIAPSDMMDGRVGAIRAALDEAGFTDTPIMAYSAKFASAFYGPFREAADSTPAHGDRRGYQMDPANGRRRSVRPTSTSRRAPTSSWSSRRSPTWTCSGASSSGPECRWPRITSAASTRWSRPLRRPGTSTNEGSSSRRSPRSGAPAPTS